MVPFAGYSMPVTYPKGLLAEHEAVRTGCGVFDVSHMGEFIVRGPDAVAFVNRVTTNDVTKLAVGQIHYSSILNNRGTFEDDCLVYRGADHLMMVVNASNAAKDFAHISRELSKFKATLEDVSEQTALLAVQGPEAEKILAPLAPGSTLFSTLGYYHFGTATFAGVPNVIVSRTGYTGEDGFEVMTSVDAGGRLLDRLVAAGCAPCGLAARDSLRLEAALPLHGVDIDETTTPWEAGLGWAVEMEHEFVGREALAAAKEQPSRRIACLLADGDGVFRHGYAVYRGDEPVGTITSGGYSPMLERSVAMAYLAPALTREGDLLAVAVRERRIACHVVKRPFYRSPSARA